MHTDDGTNGLIVDKSLEFNLHPSIDQVGADLAECRERRAVALLDVMSSKSLNGSALTTVIGIRMLIHLYCGTVLYQRAHMVHVIARVAACSWYGMSSDGANFGSF